MKITLSTIVLSVVVALGATACAEAPLTGEPMTNISPYRHGNLAAAQDMVRAAYDKLSDAQAVNDSQLGGHAAAAKALLREAAEEIKLSAIAANRRW